MTRTSSRRDFTKAVLAAGALSVGKPDTLFATEAPLPAGKATACIYLWMGGGMCQLDTFDPKVLGDPQTRKAGSAYESIPSAIRGVQVCKHLERTANILDRGAVVRTLNHTLHVDHADSSHLVKTGRMTSGTVAYPSIGSVVSQQLGPRDEGVPPYVVMGYPNSLRGPGFLGSKYTYIYLTDTESGPNGLRRPPNVDDARWRRRVQLLDTLRQGYLARNHGDHRVENYNATITEGFGMTDGDFMQAFTLDHEPDDVRERYGDEFGQRCLLARRLVASGVRFVEVAFNLNFVNGTGWDTHRHGQKDQYKLIQSLDQSVSALIEDLERNNLLETTLVVLATEFGRPAKFDGEGGRGHQSSAFTNVLFGGGLKTGQVVGVTDELSEKPVEDPVSVPDWLATIYSTLGINPAHELFAGQRPVPITDHGKPIAKLFS